MSVDGLGDPDSHLPLAYPRLGRGFISEQSGAGRTWKSGFKRYKELI